MENRTAKELWPDSIDGYPYGCFVLTVSAILFYVMSRISETFTPASAQNSRWRWKNISISLLHSFISGTWACLCFYENPDMAEDLISTQNRFSHTLVAFSFGYFVYDVWDMLAYQRSRQSYELMGHHFVIFLCFGVALVTKVYVGYAVVSLLVEINSVFLHIRQLFQICGFKRNGSLYRFNSLVNLGTFVVCRITVMAWMSRWLLKNKDFVPFVFYTLASLGLATVTVMNIILFYRLLRSDFLRKNRDTHCKEN